ncbi:beta-ketoacyl-ACP synthase III [bacterium SCSIO 12741]|nr:beta-ketoacyl-ACP synthase III [bacterium SCSIO 12741]
MSESVYINKISRFLPNEPVNNDEVEAKLGQVYEQPAKSRAIVQRSNKIQTRYYALDNDRNITHTNAQLAAEAVKGLADQGFPMDDMDFLACGTSTPDQLLPSHAAMVQGEIKSRPIEVNSFMGACVTGMQAMKSAWMAIRTGDKQHAVSTGSERCSTWLMAKNYEKEAENLAGLSQNPMLAFDKEFLRWMLSDGAGAALLESEPKGDLPLKVEWIDICSYANEMESCMYAGARKNEDGSLTGWSEMREQEWLDESTFAFKQDVRLLGGNIMQIGGRFFFETLQKHNLKPDDIDYFLPHISSEFFRDKLNAELAAHGVEIPAEKWFTNLTRVGNVGAASIYLMLDELIQSGDLKKGDRIFLCVPESARFLYAYSLLTVC